MPRSDRRLPGELGFVVAALLVSVVALWQAWRISGLASWSSPGAVPMLAALVMVLSGARIAFATARRAAAEVPEGSTLRRTFAQSMLPRVLVGLTLLIVLYMFALEPLGFVLSSFLFLVAAMRVLGSRRWLRNVLVAGASLAVIYVVFQTAFSVVLPEGVLRGLLR